MPSGVHATIAFDVSVGPSVDPTVTLVNFLVFSRFESHIEES